MNHRLVITVFLVAILFAWTEVYAEAVRRPVKLEHVPFMHLTDEQVFACACPGAVEFCKEWDKKWRQDAIPELRNQTVRECVIDFMRALEGP